MPAAYSPPYPSLSPFSSPNPSGRSSRSSSFSHSPSSSSRRCDTSGTAGTAGAAGAPAARHTRDEKKESHKIPYAFLGSIAAASLLAHKYWPKGFPHGDKEDWELSDLALRARQRRQAEKAFRRGGGGPAAAAAAAEEEEEIAGGIHLRRRRRRSSGAGASGADYGSDDYRARSSGSAWLGYHHLNQAGREDDRGQVDGGGGIHRNRHGARDELIRGYHYSSNYPPALGPCFPNTAASVSGSSAAASAWSGSGYLLERSPSAGGSLAGSRLSRLSRSRVVHDRGRDRPAEVVYIYQAPPASSRRASFHAGGRARYRGGYDAYYR